MEGFVILDYMPRAMEAIQDLMSWVSSGELIYQVDVQEGFENIPTTLQRLYNGQNLGKQLLKIGL
jgi:NADPH-dependent curcumin reductase CurA